MEEKDIDKLLREKANNIDDNKYNYKVNVDEIKYKANSKRKGIVFKVSFISTLTACIIVFIVLVVTKRYLPSNNDDVVIQGNNEMSETFKNEDVVYTVTYDKGNIYYTDDLPAFIGIIEVENVNQIGIINNIPITIVKSNIEKTFNVDNDIKEKINNEIEFTIFSCVYKVNEIPKEIENCLDEKINDPNMYIKVVPDEISYSLPYPERKKKYIVSLSYNDGTYKVNNTYKYSIYEYDENAKKVKIGDEWQDIDYEYIVW